MYNVSLTDKNVGIFVTKSSPASYTFISSFLKISGTGVISSRALFFAPNRLIFTQFGATLWTQECGVSPIKLVNFHLWLRNLHTGAL